jgi:uridine kinase
MKQMPDPDDFLAFLHALNRRRRTLVIAIDGRGGSGKSTLARRLERAGDDVAIVEIDDFYRPEYERLELAASGHTEIGGNFDWRRLRDQVLVPLSLDEPGRYQRYDWATDELAEWHIVGIGGIVIVEGNYTTRRELFAFYDYTVWVEAPHEIRLERGVRRGGHDTLDRWLTEWMPEEDRYLSAENPAQRVHLVLDGST